MSARARKKRSAHRFLLTGATCCALGRYFPITTFRRLIAHTQLTFILFHSGLAFALLRSGVRPHRGAVDRIDGGVDGDYTLDVVALEGGFSDGGGGGDGRGGDASESNLGGDQSSLETDESRLEGDSSSLNHKKTMSKTQIHDAMRRGAVTRTRDETEIARGTIHTSTDQTPGTLFSWFRFGIGSRSEGTSSSQNRNDRESNRSRRRKASLHVTRDPSTGHLTMNDVGVGAFLVSQPRPCAPIPSEADAEADSNDNDSESENSEDSVSVTAAMVRLRTQYRVGKILRQCDRVSTTIAMGIGSGRGVGKVAAKTSGELFYERFNVAGKAMKNSDAQETFSKNWGALCFTPDFLRGVASTVSVCSRNHEDGVALALFGFVSFSPDRTLVALSDATEHEPERGASAYLVHNHGFRGVFLDRDIQANDARRKHFLRRGVSESSSDDSEIRSDDDQGNTPAAGRIPMTPGAARCVYSQLTIPTVGDAVRGVLELMRGSQTGSDIEESIGSEQTRESLFAAENDESGFQKQPKTVRAEIDLATIDVADGIYLIQPLLRTVTPRVLAVSYDAVFGPDLVLTSAPAAETLLVNDETDTDENEPGFPEKKHRREGDFETTDGETNKETIRAGSNPDDTGKTPARTGNHPGGGVSASASLASFIKVLHRWGYYFVGCEAAGESAFFLRAGTCRAFPKSRHAVCRLSRVISHTD